ncbi:22500_t:CDS:1, partial [Gigaspora rosea]
TQEKTPTTSKINLKLSTPRLVKEIQIVDTNDARKSSKRS